MESLIRPLLFFVFMTLFLIFVNIVLIYMTYNNVGIILNEATYIVEKNGSEVQKIETELDQLMQDHNDKFTYELRYMNEQNFLQSTKVIISKEYKYLGRNKTLTIQKSSIAMNKQI